MGLIFFLSVIVLGGFLFSDILGVKVNFSLLISVSTIIQFGLLFAMINLLQLGVFLLYLIILLGGSIYAIRKQREFKLYLFQLPIMVFIFVCIGTLVLFKMRPPFFSAWDEFSHWGPFLFSIKNTNRLHIFNDRNFVHQAYPQAMTVLYYIGSFWGGDYDESTVCIVYSILFHICSITIIPITTITKGKVYGAVMAILTPCLFFLFPYAWYAAPYTSAYLDAILGAYFGATIFYLISHRKECNKFSNGICVSILLFVILQIKDVSIAFYMICLSTYIINAIAYSNLTGSNSFIIKIFDVFKLGIYGIGIPLIGKSMWNICLKITNKSQDQFSDSILSKFLLLIREYYNGESDYLGNVAHFFWDGIKNVSISWERTSIIVIVFFYSVIGIYIAYKYYIDEKTKIIYLHMILFNIYYICFMFMLFIIYLCAMSPGEAASNASMDRYVACFMSGWGFLLFALGSNYLYRYRPQIVLASMVVVTLFVYGSIPFNNIVYFRGNKESTGMVWFEERAEITKAYVEPDDLIWVLDANENVLWRYILSYKLMPCRIVENAPIGFDSLAIEEIVSYMNDCEVRYLVVLNSREIFWEKYDSSTINIKNDSGDQYMLFKLVDGKYIEQLY